jgi:hypothetical protein
MTDLFARVTGDQDVFKKLASHIPGFQGYIERQNRRAADKLLRETVADRFDELYKRISNIQVDLVNQGQIALLDDIERAAIQIRTFANKMRTAAYGYSGFFDAVKVNEEELVNLYAFDASFFDLVDKISGALDNVEASMGDENGLMAAIRHLISLGREAVETFERRSEVITNAGQK